MDFKLNIKTTRSIRLSFGKAVLFFIPTIFLLLFPDITYAGFWSSIASIFSGQSVSAESKLVVESSSSTVYKPSTPANNINPSPRENALPIIDGGDALLSEVGPSNEAPEKIENSNGQISVYVVRSGDTLSKIAEMFDVSANTILWANDMTKGSVLKIGQTLVILPISGVMHTVVKGDTLSTIAKKYGGDVDEIANFNDLNVTDKLSIGDTILIPDGQVSSSIRPSASSASSRLITSSGPSYSGYYMKPFVTGHKTQGLHGYNAVDYGMPIGSSLYAAAAGTVIVSKSSGWNGGYGEYVVIQHPNNTQTVYAHMSSLVVSAGQTVTQGQLIGYSGNTGKSTGPHLHFEVRGAKNPF